ncbi:hypothetical protein [Mucilaginibacter sp. PAMB04168]|uniref:hypothetical protein n=1 Tax=Mucilaginibacter sp. PAMB04168 TaxID=3138567 RepID=UPI0031F6F42A
MEKITVIRLSRICAKSANTIQDNNTFNRYFVHSAEQVFGRIFYGTPLKMPKVLGGKY